ncbi:hypothetical protein ES332_A04G112000v1 [Gossypium tomentosum]|nr:hypothetical protein ES332_A04G112000v1 [Gossypium tomentosum]
MQQAEDYFDSVMETAVDEFRRFEEEMEREAKAELSGVDDIAEKRPLSSRLGRNDYDETDKEEANRQKLYLVPYRWWKEAQRSVADEIVGILYNVLSNYDNADSEIVLDLRKEESSGTRVKMDEGVSSREYALVKEALWLRTLKWHNDSKTSEENERYYCVAEGQSQEVFPLQIRLSFSPGTNSFGLDNSGKTTIVLKINGEDTSVISPTLGFNIKTITYQKYTLNIWDVGGQRTIRSYWRNYFEQTDGLVWVVDSSDLRRLDDCKMELDNLLKEERLSGASLLILANKQDIKGALTQAEIAKILKVRQRIQSLQAGKAKA